MNSFKNKWVWVGIAVVVIAAWLMIGGDMPSLPGGETTPTE